MKKTFLVLACLASGCGDDSAGCEDSKRPFELSFSAVAGDAVVGCNSPMTVEGPNGPVRIGISDVRFYVSDMLAFDAAGNALELDLDENPFQYRSDSGEVALVDLTDRSGDCAPETIDFAEGTERVNESVKGLVSGDVARVSFVVGVPQPLMKQVVTDFTAEGAPSPLNEMHWSWALAHRHLVFNFSVRGPAGDGDGYVHVGSLDCGGDGVRALTDRGACGRINSPRVDIEVGSSRAEVGVDLSTLLEGLDFVTPIRDPTTFELLGEGPGVECHSGLDTQPDCVNVFEALGIDTADGSAEASGNRTFVSR
ncbi:MAG: MbnP family copper-binding protein [Myxococcota bacterium]